MKSVYVRGKCKATIAKDERGCLVLDVDERVKVSNHRNVFKDSAALEGYLAWLFGKYQIVACD